MGILGRSNKISHSKSTVVNTQEMLVVTLFVTNGNTDAVRL